MAGDQPRRTLPGVKHVYVIGALVTLIACPAAAAGKVVGNAAAGKTVFVTSGCGSCHALKAAKATGAIASNLDVKKPPYALVVRDVTTGVTKNGHAMPSYKGTLTARQIQDLAAFVYRATHPAQG